MTDFVSLRPGTAYFITFCYDTFRVVWLHLRFVAFGYVWLSLVTFGYVSLHFVTISYGSLRLVTIGYVSFRYVSFVSFTDTHSNDKMTVQHFHLILNLS